MTMPPVDSNASSLAQSGDSGAAMAGLPDCEALTKAFLNGAGAPNITLPTGLTPEWMEMIGNVVRVSVHGTVALSALRALVKREVNADVTMVVVRNNNPLKFFTDGSAVLVQLLRKKMPGFMGPVEAMEDAYEDLEAHQLGVVSGMRAAMADMVSRINPAGLDEKVESSIWDFLPGYRKARLWDAYTGEYQSVKQDASDDFKSLFGKAFLKAYEKEIERFKSKS